MKLFVEGRKRIFEHLKSSISSKDRIILIHAASLGEYEQAVPVIKELKKIYLNHRILLTFFSPSGYEIKKDSSLADVVTYLPIDSPNNAKIFLDLAHPELVLFIKYEFWPNILHELKLRNTKTLLISGSFRKDQIFFKSFGKWMQSYLKTFDHFFVQNESSQKLLASIGFKNASVSGDTRFDRVLDQLDQNNNLDFMKEFKQDDLCLVAGSTWPEDEEFIVDLVNETKNLPKIVIAPHVLKPVWINSLSQRLENKVVLYSEMEGKDLRDYRVLIVDTIGLLSRIYSYADIAYVGGAVGATGLHNVLEPATFGVPIITGSNISKFPEAEELKELKALYTVSSSVEFTQIILRLANDQHLRKAAGEISRNFVRKNSGATQVIIDYIERGSLKSPHN